MFSLHEELLLINPSKQEKPELRTSRGSGAKPSRLNVNTNEHGVVFNVLGIADVFNRSHRPMPFADGVAPSYWLLKGQQVGLGNQCLADVLTKCQALGLVQDAKGDLPGKWPRKEVIIIALDHLNKQSNVSSNSTVHAIQAYTQPELVTIPAGINGWAELIRLNAVDRILATLFIVFNLPYIIPIAQVVFLMVHPNKRKKILFL